MARYIVRRVIVGAIPVLIGLSIVLFLFLKLLPGDPATAILGQHYTPEKAAAIRATLGLDRPLYEQYLGYVIRLVQGDLGASFDGRQVIDTFLIRFPVTLELTIGALIFACGVGIPLGRLAARHPNGWIDGIVTVISLFGISIPVFVLGYTLAFVFAVQLHWLPSSLPLDPRRDIPAVTNFPLIDAALTGDINNILDALSHLVLPSIALGSIPLAIVTRITRASVIDVSNEDYVRTARAKGISEGRVDRRHIMRNAWLPVTTVIGLQVGSLLAGAVLTETVFNWAGVGSWVVTSILNHDYIVVQSLVMIFAVIFLVVNLVVDILYAFLNPRIRYT